MKVKGLNTACLGLLRLSPVARIKRWCFTFPQITDTHLNCKCGLHNFYNLCYVTLHLYVSTYKTAVKPEITSLVGGIKTKCFFVDRSNQT